jgi:DNA polymerase V
MDGEDIYGAAYREFSPVNRPQEKKMRTPGFGAFVDEFMDRGIDLNEQLIRNKPSTYFFRMKGDAMRDAGIFDDDLLIVDRSIKLADGKIIVAVLNGELLVRRFHKNFSSAFLIPENDRYKPVNLAEFSDFVVWGVVTYVVHGV